MPQDPEAGQTKAGSEPIWDWICAVKPASIWASDGPELDTVVVVGGIVATAVVWAAVVVAAGVLAAAVVADVADVGVPKIEDSQPCV